MARYKKYTEEQIEEIIRKEREKWEKERKSEPDGNSGEEEEIEPEEEDDEEDQELGDDDGRDSGTSIEKIIQDKDVSEYISREIKKGITEALKGKKPKVSAAKVSEAELSNFKKMSYKERVNLFKSEPVKYNELVKLSN